MSMPAAAMRGTASRMLRLRREGMMEALAKAMALEAQGEKIVHMEVGEPDFNTPLHITEAAIKALRDGETHYCPSPGIPALRKAIMEDVSRSHGIEVTPNQVIVTPGSKPVILMTAVAVLEKGDEAIYPDPGFPTFERAIDFVGAIPVPIPLLESRGLRFDIKELRAKLSSKTKLIILNSPSNPTGSTLEKSDIEAVAEIALERNLYVLSDEIYSRLQYDGQFLSIASLPGMAERTIILDGFSKPYAMTGWRLGYAVMPENVANEAIKLIISTTSCVPPFIQRAGIAALQGPKDGLDEMVKAYRERRDVIVEGLRHIKGFRVIRPQGAFYVFPNVEEFGMPSGELVDYLLAEAKVATMPGTSFGKYGAGFIRMSYANSVENLKEGLKRIAVAVEKLHTKARLHGDCPK